MKYSKTVSWIVCSLAAAALADDLSDLGIEDVGAGSPHSSYPEPASGYEPPVVVRTPAPSRVTPKPVPVPVPQPVVVPAPAPAPAPAPFVATPAPKPSTKPSVLSIPVAEQLGWTSAAAAAEDEDAEDDLPTACDAMTPEEETRILKAPQPIADVVDSLLDSKPKTVMSFFQRHLELATYAEARSRQLYRVRNPRNPQCLGGVKKIFDERGFTARTGKFTLDGRLGEGSAKNAGTWLTRNGFVKLPLRPPIDWKAVPPSAVVVCGGGRYGHVEIWTGRGYASDYYSAVPRCAGPGSIRPILAVYFKPMKETDPVVRLGPSGSRHQKRTSGSPHRRRNRAK